MWTNNYAFVYSVSLFFFKQRTAYELRISDWSSYVCSSDLDHRVGMRKDPEFDVAVSIRQLVIAFAHLGPAALFDPLGEVEGGDHRALDLGCDAEQAEREPLRPIQVRVRRRVAPARLAIGADQAKAARSEEPTSEIQSLMR